MSKSLYKILRPFFIYFGLMIALLSCLCLYTLFAYQSLISVPILIFLLYFAAPLMHRLMQSYYPIKQGATLIKPDEYNPWINSFRLQKLYNSFPFIERALFLVPGLYNSWLRLWGSKIGKGVYLLPGVEIVDRGHVEFGDYVFIGNKTYISPHVAMNSKGQMYVYFKNVKIENSVFVGAFSKLGPGTKIAANQVIPAGSVYLLNARAPEKTSKSY